MKRFHTVQRVTAIGAVGLLGVLAVGGTAYATTSTTPSTPAPAARTAAKHRTLLARADKATVEIKVKGQWVTYTIDRGKVTVDSPTSITLALADGQSVTEAITATTKFGGVMSATGLTTGKGAVVVSTNGTATRIDQRAATATPAS